MKNLICGIVMIGLLVTMANVSALGEQWLNIIDRDKQMTVAYVHNTKTDDMFVVRFNRNKECKSSVGIASKVKKGFDFENTDTKYQIRIDDNKPWYTDTTHTTKINNKLAYFSMGGNYDIIQELKEGTVLRNKIFNAYYKYSLINSSKALDKARTSCLKFGVLVDPDAKYFN